MSRFSDGLKKVAVIGPLIDIRGFGIPSGIGYVMGKDQVTRTGDTKELIPPSGLGMALKYALLPGYTGYRLGLAHGYEENKLRKKHRESSKDKDKDKDEE